ncbi:MAG: 30S ribosomal protein S14 [Rickettsiaceae bacterium]|nr:30S ribosomal protein S14 [Rickettsiaceae bacterium]
MAKIGSIQRNNKRKRMAKSFAKKRAKIKSEIYDKKLPLEDRFALVVKLAKLPRNSSKSRVRNRCAMTGRPRGYYRKIGLSRNMLRELAAQGLLPGMVKASW